MTGGWRPRQPLLLETARFQLRSLGRGDASDRWTAWAADPALMNPLNTAARPIARDELVRYIESFDNDNAFLLGVFDRVSGLHVGFYAVNVDKPNRSATTNVVIGDTAYWGQRVVLETRAALLDFLFDTVGVDKVIGVPFAENHAAIYNYKAQGFTLEGVLRQQRLSFDGRRRLDQCHFGMLRAEWHARRRAARP
jgi:ribosomal-protein-alanine N-acetyltransferase